jgi:raffinose/stachyose/melibiose transport system permease protein
MTTRTPARRSRLGHMPATTILVFLLPALVLYAMFVLYPIVQSARYSTYGWNGFGPLENFVGLQNFRDVFADTRFRAALGHNLAIVGLSLLLQLPAALALAMLLNAKLKGRAVMRTVFFAPYVLSEVVTGVVWRKILRPDGLLDQSLDGAGLGGVVQGWLSGPDVVLYALFFVVSWKYFGFHMILLLAGLQQIPGELLEAASIDGASPWKAFRHVTFPLLLSTVRVSVFLSVIGALQLFDMVWVTTKGGPIGASSTMSTYLYDRFRDSRFGFASAVSIVIFGLSLVVALLYQRFALRRDLEGAGHGE